MARGAPKERERCIQTQNVRESYNDTDEELIEAFKAERQKKAAAGARKVAQENYAQLVDELAQNAANKV